MSDPVILTSTPQGSPILAYGSISSSGSSTPKSWKWLAILATAVVVIVGLGWAVLESKLPVPTETFAFAYLSSKIALPAEAPSAWREAQRQTGHFPLFVGLARNADGQPVAFAIRHKALGWELVQDDNSLPTTPKTLGSALSSWKTLLSPAWLTVWPGKLLGTSTGTDLPTLSGPIEQGQWKTDAQAPSGLIKGVSRLLGQNYLRLRAVPQAWSSIQGMLTNSGYDLGLDTPPDTLTWSFTSGTELSLGFSYDEQPSTTTLSQIGAAAGLVDRLSVTLPDGTSDIEESLPERLFSESTSTHWTSARGTEMSIQGNTIVLGSAAGLEEGVDVPMGCKTKTLAVFSGMSLNSLFTAMGLPTARVSAVAAHDDGGHLTFCW